MDDRAERKRGEFLMATYLTDSSDLTSVANAIRIKGGTSAQMAFPAGFVSAVQAIPTGTTPTGTKSISITQNGTTTEDVAAYANAEITVDVQGGGGGKGFMLLDTITVSSDARAVNLDFSDYQSYDFFFVVEDVNLSASDWLYFLRNGSSPSGGSYAQSVQHHYGVCFMQIKTVPSKSGVTLSEVPNASGPSVTYNIISEACTNLYIYTYSESKTILAGSKFYICGGNYADL